MIMRPGRIVVVMATVSALFVPSGLSERIKYKSTKNEGATIPLPECDVVKIESKKSCRQDYSEIGLQVAWNSHSLNASSLFRCYCESLVGGIYIEYFHVSSIQLEISREILQASPYCNMKISDPKLRTLKGRTLTISSGEEMEWELYIPGDCNTYLTWKTATFATGAVAILFLAATLSLAVCILLQKQNTRSSRGQETVEDTHLEMPNNYETPNATYRETENALYDNPGVLWDVGGSTSNIFRGNRPLGTNQRSPTGDSELYDYPQWTPKGRETFYENVTDRAQNSDNMYVNLPVTRSYEEYLNE